MTTTTISLQPRSESYQIALAAQISRAPLAEPLPISVRCAKRCIDLAFALIGLAAAVWLLPVIALLIYVDTSRSSFRSS